MKSYTRKMLIGYAWLCGGMTVTLTMLFAGIAIFIFKLETLNFGDILMSLSFIVIGLVCSIGLVNDYRSPIGPPFDCSKRKVLYAPTSGD